MKKYSVFISILIIIVLLISCSEGAKDRTKANIDENITETIDPKIIEEIGIVNIFEYTSNSFFFSSEDIMNGYDYSDDRISWSNYIESLFNIKLNISCSYDTTGAGAGDLRYKTTQYYNAIMEGIDNGNIVGLYNVQDLQALKILKEAGYILPFDQFIVENSNWNSLPTEWRNAYSIDGNIWAIPSTYIDTITFRYIRGDWLENLNLEMPGTIDEFYETMYQFTYDDPDMDNSDNTYGALYLDPYSISDLFSSFDARLNYKGEAIPCWNPNSNMWEDSMLKPEFSECLMFVKKCIDENIMLNNLEAQSNERFFKGYIGSVFSRDTRNILANTYIKEYRPNNGEPKIEYIPGLIHYIDKNVTGYYTLYYYPKVLTKNSKYPSSSINILINDFIADYDGFMLAHNGLLDTSYRMVDEFVVGKKIEEDGQYYPYQIPNIIGRSPLYDISYASDLHTPEVYEAWQTHYSRFQITMSNELCYKIPHSILYNNSSSLMETNLKSLANTSRNIINNIILGNISYEEGLERYRSAAKKLDIQEFLDEQNKLLGKTSNQKY